MSGLGLGLAQLRLQLLALVSQVAHLALQLLDLLLELAQLRLAHLKGGVIVDSHSRERGC